MSLNPNYLISAVIVSFGRPIWLKRCVEALIAAKNAHNNIQANLPSQPRFHIVLTIHVLINGNDSQSHQTMCDLKILHPNTLGVSISRNRLGPAEARNRILNHMRNENGLLFDVDWIYFVDDDAFTPLSLFSQFLDSIRRFPEAVVVGGPNLTPPDSSLFQNLTGLILGSRLGTMKSFSRYRAHGEMRICDETSLILCNLFVHQNCLQRFENQTFSEDLVCAEENFLLQNIGTQGGKSVYNPDLFVWHERRLNLLQFSMQIFKYGYGRGQLIRKSPLSIKYFHLLPSCYLLSFCLVLKFPILFKAGCFYLLACLSYTILLVLKSSLVEKCIRSHAIASCLFPVLHFSYAFGVLSGLIKHRRRI